MTSVVPLVAGEVLVPVTGSAWAERWREIKLVNEHKFKNTTYWWCEMTDTSGMTHLDTMNIGTLRTNWTRKEKFFQLGSKYKMKPTNRFSVSDTYLIKDLYQIDNPLSRDQEWSAFAVAKDAMTGKQYGTSLNKYDFDRMVKV